MCLTRRDFMAAAGVAGLGAVTSPAGASRRPGPSGGPADDRTVHPTGDGIPIDPPGYAALLSRLCGERAITPDGYLLGGEVERFEQFAAEALGKERAVFLPSGTLANQLAIRALAGNRRRVVVQEMSHVYNDTGDACQILSGLNLIPLAAGQAVFSRADVERVLERTAGGRVAAEVGAILIESPVRRLFGQVFDFEEMKRISALARERGIGLHLDGARLFLASAYTGIRPAEYAALFDTVYISLWKYFNCGIGAILAGPKSLLDGMHHTRRMFGGNLWNGWPAALVARHFMTGFADRFGAAVRVSEDFYSALGRERRFKVVRIPNGTNLARVAVDHPDPALFRRRAEEQGVALSDARNGEFLLAVNETWNRVTAAELVDRFRRALG